MTAEPGLAPRYRIALIASHLPRGDNGGAERQALRTAGELAQRGHTVWLFVRGVAERSRRLDTGVHIVERRELHLPRGFSRLAPVRFVWDVVRGMRDLSHAHDRLDIVVTYNTLICGFIGAAFALQSGTPLVVWIRGEGEYRGDRTLKGRVLAPLVWMVARRILVQTPAIAEEFGAAVDGLAPRFIAARIRNKVRVLPNGVDVPERFTPPSHQRQLLFVGRLVERKGIEHLIRALPSIPGARLSIVGEGVDATRLRGLAAALPIDFSGAKPQPELASDYEGASLLVLPSTFGEGLPNVVLEAMAYGRPAVVTRTAGAIDLVVDGVNGVLVEPGSPEALATKIRGLLDTPSRLDAMGEAARRTAAAYAWPALVKQVETMVAQVLA